MPPILSVSNLTIRRGETRILDDLSWTVRRGEHWVILGANGSGKTSLLSSLTGYLSPTSGSISVLGQTFGETDWRELRTHVGLVSSSVRQMLPDHEPALITVISGKYAMIDYWGRIKTADRLAAARILRQIEASHLAERRWEVLSQGERQRILIGRALMAKPRLLILDEPCAGLDPVAREHFLAFIQRLGSQRGAPALIFVTHHVEEIMPVFTHALLLRGGSVLATGKKRAVLTSAHLSETFNAPLRLAQRTLDATHCTPLPICPGPDNLSPCSPSFHLRHAALFTWAVVLLATISPLRGEDAGKVDPVVVDPPTEAVINGALRYLAAQQQTNGSWTAQGRRGDHPVAITGYALLAFMAAGNLPEEGDYARQVNAGMQYLLDAIQMDGTYRDSRRGPIHVRPRDRDHRALGTYCMGKPARRPSAPNWSAP